MFFAVRNSDHEVAIDFERQELEAAITTLRVALDGVCMTVKHASAAVEEIGVLKSSIVSLSSQLSSLNVFNIV